MSRPPSPLPDSLSAGVFTRREALRAGATPDRLLAEDIAWIGRGLYSRVGRDVDERDIVAAYTRLEEDTAACGLTAARIWGLPLPWEHSAKGIEAVRARAEEAAASASGRARAPETAVVEPTSSAEVDATGTGLVPGGEDDSASRPASRRRVRRVRGGDSEGGPAWAPPPVHLTSGSTHRRNSAHVTWHRRLAAPPGSGSSSSGHPRTVEQDGIRLTSRVQTWLDLGTVLSREDLTIIGDHLVRVPRSIYEGRTGPYCSVQDLVEAAAGHRGPGGKRLREAAADVRAGSDSPAETRIRLAVLAAGLPEPALNPVLNEPGSWLGVPDLAWPAWKVCVEHEGASHREKQRFEEDITRTENRQQAGWVEVRTVTKDLRNSCTRAVERIERALRGQGWDGRRAEGRSARAGRN